MRYLLNKNLPYDPLSYSEIGSQLKRNRQVNKQVHYIFISHYGSLKNGVFDLSRNSLGTVRSES